MTEIEAQVGAWLRRAIAGKPWIVASDVAVSATRQGAELMELGAERVLALAASRGTGDLNEGIEVHHLDATAHSMMHAIRQGEALLEAEPFAMQAQVDAFDPQGQARVIRQLFSRPLPVGGRPVYGARRPEWIALEDKTTVDAFWDAAGVPRAPSQVVPLEPQALERAHATLDRGAGTVWAGDNRSGWHGGAEYLRWVRRPHERAAALAELAVDCDSARVMPFLEGIPCSVHGIVFDDHLVALRPCEMLVLRKAGTMRLQYATAATFWDPPANDREHMRDVARRVGEHLRHTVGYRGVFTVDGVMTSDGFLPTELNPRFGAAIGSISHGMPGLHLYLLHVLLTEGVPVDWSPQALEQAILSSADAQRSGRTGLVVAKADVEASTGLDWVDGLVVEVPEGPADAQLSIGPHAMGSYVHLRYDPERTPVGPSTAPRAAALLAWVDQRYDLGLGPLTPAPDVRR